MICRKQAAKAWLSAGARGAVRLQTLHQAWVKAHAADDRNLFARGSGPSAIELELAYAHCLLGWRIQQPR
jgi:hypothetical protein